MFFCEKFLPHLKTMQLWFYRRILWLESPSSDVSVYFHMPSHLYLSLVGCMLINGRFDGISRWFQLEWTEEQL